MEDIVEDDGVHVEMVDEGSAIVERDETEVEGTAEVDDVRAAIYKKHDDLRHAEIHGEAEVEKDEAPDEEMIVKVNGREKMVLRSKVEASGGVEIFQKNAAASERLNQASEAERRIAAEKVRLGEIEQYLLQQARDIDRKHSTPEPPNTGALKELADKYHEALMSGEMDEAGDLMLQLQEARQATSGDADKIAAKAVQQARQEINAEQTRANVEAFNRERNEAAYAFLSEDSVLTRDPELIGMVDAKTITIMAEHPDWGPARVIDEATTRVTAWVSKVTTKTPDKLSAKRGLDVVKGGSARAVPQQGPKVQTSSEYVAALRKQRGLE